MVNRTNINSQRRPGRRFCASAQASSTVKTTLMMVPTTVISIALPNPRSTASLVSSSFQTSSEKPCGIISRPLMPGTFAGLEKDIATRLRIGCSVTTTSSISTERMSTYSMRSKGVLRDEMRITRLLYPSGVLKRYVPAR
ncbi:Uncharacterised protein [Enterobacter cloacae]|nr:Uncharacterised protein [Enterobacter cloacae]